MTVKELIDEIERIEKLSNVMVCRSREVRLKLDQARRIVRDKLRGEDAPLDAVKLVEESIVKF